MTLRSCPDLATLETLLDDTLSTAELAALAEHLDRCEACRTRLEDLAMPPQFRFASGKKNTAKADPPAQLPRRELIELWQRQVPTAHSGLRTNDTAATILNHLEPAQEADEL